MNPAKPDLSEFRALSKPKKKPCAVEGPVFKDQGERDQFEAACNEDPRVITAGAIMEWLKRRGITSSPPGVTAHRKGKCSCYD